MRCTTHRRNTVGACNWCGKQVCPYCIGKKEGKKIYCEKCTLRLSNVKRAKIPPPQIPQRSGARAQPVIEEKPTQQKKIFSVDEEGYLILEQ